MSELQKARDQLEGTLLDYTDLYDFAPVAIFPWMLRPLF